MKQFFIALFILIFAAVQLSGQKENYTWYFGDRAGLDFNTSPPTPLKGAMLAHEGVASISD
ncbi:MAG TPA: hypothetical protein VFF90_13980, partial [Saprospiraceae bacterium]|nr:hypothetical protein [Saprospiraceae bacterium]